MDFCADRAWQIHDAQDKPAVHDGQENAAMAPASSHGAPPSMDHLAGSQALPKAPGATITEVLSNVSPLFSTQRTIRALKDDHQESSDPSETAYLEVTIPGTVSAFIGLSGTTRLEVSTVVILSPAEAADSSKRRPLQPSRHAIFRELTRLAPEQVAARLAHGQDNNCSPLELLLLWLALHAVRTIENIFGIGEATSMHVVDGYTHNPIMTHTKAQSCFHSASQQDVFRSRAGLTWSPEWKTWAPDELDRPFIDVPWAELYAMGLRLI